VTKAIIEQDRPIKAELEKTSGTANKTNPQAIRSLLTSEQNKPSNPIPIAFR